jgi:16S rRNA (guanine966-N2)-methyltransferase
MVGSGDQLRIIGGRWRSRRLHFPDVEGLRPTPDRVRETLFNWLAPLIEGARCLDLFAGSGALGIEALSRGAAEVIFIERQPLAARQLRQNLAQLGEPSAQVIQTDALVWLGGPSRPFDVIFLDPPFGVDLLVPACKKLEQGDWLADGARIYLETERDAGNLELPENWKLIREKTAGQVSYRLAVRNA